MNIQKCKVEKPKILTLASYLENPKAAIGRLFSEDSHTIYMVTTPARGEWLLTNVKTGGRWTEIRDTFAGITNGSIHTWIDITDKWVLTEQC